jgi:hypothetical protein
LINARAGAPVISPSTGFTAAGAAGGPFSPSSVVYTLTNSSSSNLLWSLVNTCAWLNVSSASGTLPTNTGTNVTISLSAAAYTLVAGNYSASIIFSNRTAVATQDFSFQLQIGQSLIQNGGFETGGFTPWILDGRGPYINWVDNGSIVSPHSGSYVAAFGEDNGSVAYLSQSFKTIPGQGYLLSFWLTDNAGGGTALFQANWNTNAAMTNTIYGRTNPVTAFGWTNLNFIVTAAGTNTTLQFATKNVPGYWGLDDVSIMAIPTPTVTSFSKTPNNTFVFTWNSLAGITNVVQYRTNLLQTNWIGLATNVASTNTLSYTNVIGTNATRFFRVYRLP